MDKLKKLIEVKPELYEIIKEKRLSFSQGLAKEITHKKILYKKNLNRSS